MIWENALHILLHKQAHTLTVTLLSVHREDDNDRSDDDEEPVHFSAASREQHLRKIRDTILDAEQGGCSKMNHCIVHFADKT